MVVFKSTSAVKCLRIVWNGLSVQKNMQDITLINPKQAQDFVRRKLQLLNTWGTVAPRSSIRFFFQTGSNRPENKHFCWFCSATFYDSMYIYNFFQSFLIPNILKKRQIIKYFWKSYLVVDCISICFSSPDPKV